MGAWGSGPFENDTAMDFVDDLVDLLNGEDRAGERLVARCRQAFEAVVDAAAEGGEDDDDAYVEAPEGEEAVAAAGLLALAAGGKVPADDDVVGWVASTGAAVGQGVAAEAVRALDLVMSEDSELPELWEDAGALDELEAAIEALKAVLMPLAAV